MHVRLFHNGASIDGHILNSIVSAQSVATLWPKGLVGEDDESWDWCTLVKEHSSDEWLQFEIQANDQAQGLMILKKEWDLRSPSHTSLQGCYIEYLATAPWNRRSTEDRRFPRVVPVGLPMLGVAIERSISLRHEGRLAWHSKPGAEDWYKSHLPGLWSGGPDASEGGLEYFELPASAAKAALVSINPLFGKE